MRRSVLSLLLFVLMAGGSAQAQVIGAAPTGGNAVYTLSWDGALGGLTATAVAPMVAPCAGKFTELTCTATLTGSCTTGPTINVKDITGATSGTAVSPTTTVATLAQSTETLAVALNDNIGLAQTATVSACTAPSYHCTATLSCP